MGWIEREAPTGRLLYNMAICLEALASATQRNHFQTRDESLLRVGIAPISVIDLSQKVDKGSRSAELG